jgi:hypothetical protein
MSPDTDNSYTYCWNNPSKVVDPDGKAERNANKAEPKPQLGYAETSLPVGDYRDIIQDWAAFLVGQKMKTAAEAAKEVESFMQGFYANVKPADCCQFCKDLEDRIEWVKKEVQRLQGIIDAKGKRGGQGGEHPGLPEQSEVWGWIGARDGRVAIGVDYHAINRHYGYLAGKCIAKCVWEKEQATRDEYEKEKDPNLDAWSEEIGWAMFAYGYGGGLSKEQQAVVTASVEQGGYEAGELKCLNDLYEKGGCTKKPPAATGTKGGK